MSDTEEAVVGVPTCPTHKHLWRPTRGMNKFVEGRWYNFLKCKNCPTLFEVIIQHRIDGQGNVIPESHSCIHEFGKPKTLLIRNPELHKARIRKAKLAAHAQAALGKMEETSGSPA